MSNNSFTHILENKIKSNCQRKNSCIHFSEQQLQCKLIHNQYINPVLNKYRNADYKTHCQKLSVFCNL